MKVVVVDNYDSFTYNLVEYLSDQRVEREATAVEVVKNSVPLSTVRAADPDALVISPGPGHPANERDVGVTDPVLRELSREVPTLGVCLGLEAAVYAYGGTVGHAPEPIHGKAFPVTHDGRGVFAGLEQGFSAGRYHSLVATEVPDCFDVTATTRHPAATDGGGTTGEDAGTAGEDRGGPGGERAPGHAGSQPDGRENEPGDGESAPADGNEGGATDLVMGVRHREYPIEAVQFHPESVLTAVGHDLLGNFLRECV